MFVVTNQFIGSGIFITQSGIVYACIARGTHLANTANIKSGPKNENNSEMNIHVT